MTGWGKRPYNWGLGISVQQEVAPRVSVNVGYFRNWWGNWYTVDNRAVATTDYTPFSISGAGRSAAAERRRLHRRRAVQPRPDKVGAVDELATSVEELRAADRELAGRGRRRQRAAAERPHGAGRHEHRAPRSPMRARSKRRDPGAGPGHARRDDLHRAAARRTNPYCRVVEPYQTSIRGARDVHDSEDRAAGERHVGEQSRGRPRGELHGDQRHRAADARPRPFVRQRHGEPDCAGHVLRGSAQQHRPPRSRRSSGSAGRGRRSASTSTTSRTRTS